jgi:hypothetical protein
MKMAVNAARRIPVRKSLIVFMTAPVSGGIAKAIRKWGGAAALQGLAAPPPGAIF